MKILFVVFVSLLLFVQVSFGECISMTLEQSLGYADAVFVGKVLHVSEFKSDKLPRRENVELFGTSYKVRVKVEKYWKGTPTKETSFLIYFGGSETDWSLEFKTGERFLIFAKKGRDIDELFAVPCTGTDKIENAKKDLVKLGKGKKIK